MIRWIAFAGLLVLAACQHQKAAPDPGLAGYDPDLLEKQRAQCEASGGRFGAASGKGTYVCYRNTSDANKICSSGLDCEGLCLARSQSCAPVTPMFGCHEVLADSGARATICIE